MWFRAVFEISTRRTGISAMDLMRIMGFGSYKTAWTWLHKLRAALVRPEREPLGPFVQMERGPRRGKTPGTPLSTWYGHREGHLDQAPSPRKIAIILRQDPDGVHMVRQQDHGVDMEGMAPLRMAHRIPQHADVLHEQAAAAIEKFDREEPAGARDERATVIRHATYCLRIQHGAIHP
ncbi:MAG: hypothetical protein WAN86_13365 [Hyphomicrobiaceae bacterium]